MTTTVVDLPGIDARGKGTVIFVPAIANINAPKLTELNAAGAVNLTCAIYGWSPSAEQSTVERTKYCYTATVSSLGAPTYSIEPVIYDYDPQNIEDSDPYGYYAKLTPGTQGYIIDRRGLTKEVALAAGQIVDIYPVTLGVQGRVPIDATAEGEKLRITQTFAVSGDPVMDVTIADAA